MTQRLKRKKKVGIKYQRGSFRVGLEEWGSFQSQRMKMKLQLPMQLELKAPLINAVDSMNDWKAYDNETSCT